MEEEQVEEETSLLYSPPAPETEPPHPSLPQTVTETLKDEQVRRIVDQGEEDSKWLALELRSEQERAGNGMRSEPWLCEDSPSRVGEQEGHGDQEDMVVEAVTLQREGASLGSPCVGAAAGVAVEDGVADVVVGLLPDIAAAPSAVQHVYGKGKDDTLEMCGRSWGESSSEGVLMDHVATISVQYDSRVEQDTDSHVEQDTDSHVGQDTEASTADPATPTLAHTQREDELVSIVESPTTEPMPESTYNAPASPGPRHPGPPPSCPHVVALPPTPLHPTEPPVVAADTINLPMLEDLALIALAPECFQVQVTGARVLVREGYAEYSIRVFQVR